MIIAPLSKLQKKGKIGGVDSGAQTDRISKASAGEQRFGSSALNQSKHFIEKRDCAFMNIALVSMPFARLDFPSLALEQLKTLLRNRFSTPHRVEIFYLNHDLLDIVDVDVYKQLAGRTVYINYRHQLPGGSAEPLRRAMKRRRPSGLGEWLFRSLAYPDAPDNMEKFLEYGFHGHPEAAERLVTIRQRLPEFLDTVLNRYALADYDVIALTSLFEQHNPNLALVQTLRRRNPHCLILMGGNNYHNAAGVYARHCEGVDYLLSGPGYAGAIDRIEEFHRTRRRPAGIEVVCSGEEDIDRAVNLDYEDFYHSFERQRHRTGPLEPTVFWETSRGCWWGEKSRCTFCDYNKRMTFDAMQASMSVGYLQRILDQGRGRCRYYWAVDSILPVDYIERVFPHLKIPDSARIFYEVRATLSAQQLQKLHGFHVSMVQCGIEALDTSTLKLLKKGMTGPGNLRFLRDCAQYGLSVLWNFLCGVPGEEIDRFYRLLELLPRLRHLYPPTGMWAISYDRNSDYVQNRKKYGLSLTPSTEALGYAFPFPASELNQIAYFYENNEIQTVMTREKIKLIQKINGEILAWQRRWQSDEDADLPRLYLTRHAKEAYVTDTRGQALEVPLSAEAVELIEYLCLPRTDEALRRHFGQRDLRQEWRKCVEAGLIWREADSAQSISLITQDHPALPKPFSALDGWIWE